MKHKKITPLEFINGDYQKRIEDRQIAVLWGNSPVHIAHFFNDKIALYGDCYLGISDPNSPSLTIIEDMTDSKVVKQHLMEYVTNAIINTPDEYLYALFEQIYGEI